MLVVVWAIGPAIAAQSDPLPVVTTLPYLAEIVREVGGELVAATALAPPGVDPHHLDTTPAMTVQVRAARLFVANGLELETWSRRIIDAAANPYLSPGTAGYVEAGAGIAPLEVPAPTERAAGTHVHAAGNPHVWLDPLNLKIIARSAEEALGKVFYTQREELAANRRDFERRVDEAFFGADLVRIVGGRRLELLHRSGRLEAFLQARRVADRPLAARLGGWLARSRRLGQPRVFAVHRTWSYFERTFGLTVVGTVEEKPGIPPSPAHLERLRDIAAATGARLVIAPPYFASASVRGAAEHLGGRAVELPTQPGESERTTLVGLFDDIFDRLEAGLAATRDR